MYTFTISVAGYKIAIETEREYSYKMCVSFITEGVPDFCISVSPEDVSEEIRINGLKEPISDRLYEDCEFLALLRKIADELVERNVLLIHGAAITLDNKSYLFTAKSGTGKTTHICRWIQNRPDLVVINGDKPFIRVDNIPMICGSPWAGKEGFSANIMKPLDSIIILERHDDNIIHKISFSEAFPILLNSIYLSLDMQKRNKAIKLLIDLNQKITFYKYQMNNLKEDCFQVIYDEIH